MMGQRHLKAMRRWYPPQFQILCSNQPFFSGNSVAQLLSAFHAQKPITKAKLAKKAGISEVYLHQVLSGRRNPSRDRLNCLCVGLEATLDETQELLKRVAYAPLYPKLKRDAIICHGIIHHTPLSAINDKLHAENENSLL